MAAGRRHGGCFRLGGGLQVVVGGGVQAAVGRLVGRQCSKGGKCSGYAVDRGGRIAFWSFTSQLF